MGERDRYALDSGIVGRITLNTILAFSHVDVYPATIWYIKGEPL